MPFGLKNAHRTIKEMIYVIFSTLKSQYTLLHLEDVIIFSKNFEQNLEHVHLVLYTFWSKLDSSWN